MTDKTEQSVTDALTPDERIEAIVARLNDDATLLVEHDGLGAEEIARNMVDAADTIDTLRARIKELEEDAKDHGDAMTIVHLQGVEAGKDVMRAENERLTACLKEANISAEHFERLWYLECDRGEALRAQLAEAQKGRDSLRKAVEFCRHKATGMRVWGGMGWKYHPPQAKAIFDAANSALNSAAIDAAKGEPHA